MNRAQNFSNTNDQSYVVINSQENAKWTGEYRNVCLARPPDYSFYG